MKKIKLILVPIMILVIAATFAMTACKKSDSGTNTSTATSTVTSTPASTVTSTVDSTSQGSTDNSANAPTEEKKADYVNLYQIAVENEETGETDIVAAERTPIISEGIAAAYGGSFGAFVDDVRARGSLYIDGDNYKYVWECLCGTDGESGYFPVFTFTGKIVYRSDVAIQISAPTYAEEEIKAYGQFATNEEQIGYFGAVGYVSKSTDETCPYPVVPFGDRLLGLMGEGVFIINPKTNQIEAFAAGTVHATTYQIAKENEETGETEIVPAEGTLLTGGLEAAYGGSFGAFVDDVQAKGYLMVNGDKYAYVWEVLCGTQGENGYFPIFAWWGTASVDGENITIEAPDYGMVVINAYGQFATNEEQIGYFGSVGYVATSEDETCPYPVVPFGARILGQIAAGTYEVK